MNRHRLREIILNLQDRLSNDDRNRLHFYLGNDVPRRIRDDPSLSGTLKLMDSLFDQDKINEQNFTFLINAFDQIHCVDAAKLLREHLEQNRANGRSRSTETLSLIMPSLGDQIFEDQEDDKFLAKHLPINLQTIYGHSNVMINSNHTNINPLPTTVRDRHSQSEGEQTLNSWSMSRKLILLILVLSIVGCGLLMVFTIVNTIHNKELRVKHSQSIELITQLKSQMDTLQDKKFSIFKESIPDRTSSWRPKAITVAGGHGPGNRLDQLNNPYSIYLNHDDESIFIADTDNHRIMKWKKDADKGEVVAAGNGPGNQLNQLNNPISVIMDREGNNLIICDSGNRRVVYWSLRNITQKQTVLPIRVDCYGLAMDRNESLYISDSEKHEVRRWNKNYRKALTAGGNGQGNRSDQLSIPTNIFVDSEYSVYVSDWDNHRVMKWTDDSKTGVKVASSQDSSRLLAPQGIFVDSSKTLYVADYNNHHIMRWFKDAQEGDIVVGGNGPGKQANQLDCPEDLTFDRQGNLYVVDRRNHRIQKFMIDGD